MNMGLIWTQFFTDFSQVRRDHQDSSNMLATFLVVGVRGANTVQRTKLRR